MKMRLTPFIIIMLLQLNTAMAQVGSGVYLHRAQASIEEFNSYTSKGMGTLAMRSLDKAMVNLDKLKKIDLSADHKSYYEELIGIVSSKKKLDPKTINTCDYRNISYFKEFDHLKHLYAHKRFISYRAQKKLLFMKINEVKYCKQYSTWLNGLEKTRI